MAAHARWYTAAADALHVHGHANSQQLQQLSDPVVV
jgi:hypothetical protein